MSFHHLEGIGSRHPAMSWEYANAALRLAASGFVAADLGSLAWQQDDNSVYILTTTTPTWVPVGTSSSDADRLVLEVRKSTSGTILKGRPCYFITYNPSGWIEVELADADAAGKIPALGLAAEDITNTATGNLVVSGKLIDLDTSSWSEGDYLWVSATLGLLTSTKPIGSTTGIQKIAQVIRSHVSEGVLLVTGAHRVNDVPNIAQDNFWKGDSNGVAQPIPLATLNSSLDHGLLGGLSDDDHPQLDGCIHGFTVSRATVSTVTVSSGMCRNGANDGYISRSSSLSLDITSSGANGLDTGSETSNTWYCVFVIYNPSTTTVAGLLSISQSAPTMPSGYTKKRLVGCVRNDDDGDLLDMRQIGNGKRRLCFYFDGSHQVMSAGSQTSWTDVDLSDYVSPISMAALFRIRNNLETGYVYVRPNGSTGAEESTKVNGSEIVPVCATDDSQIIEYYISGSTSGGINVYAYYEEL